MSFLVDGMFWLLSILYLENKFNWDNYVPSKRMLMKTILILEILIYILKPSNNNSNSNNIAQKNLITSLSLTHIHNFFTKRLKFATWRVRQTVAVPIILNNALLLYSDSWG